MKSKIIIVFLLSIMRVLYAESDSNFVEQESSRLQSSNLTLSKIPLTLASLKRENINCDPLDYKIDYGILACVGAITISAGIGVHIHQANAWWRNQVSTFRIINDWDYALWLDKVGHFHATIFLAHFFSAGLEAANFQTERATLYSAIAAFAFQMYVEIEDGFGVQWGFSPGDAGSDLLGAAYFLGQYYFPVLKNFQPRVSYYPTKEYLNGEKPDANAINDYEGQKLWLGIRMKKLLPEAVSEYWPSFLVLSVGMGVRDLTGNGGGQQEFYLALDLDAEELPLSGGLWQFVKNTLSYIHFPLPGIRISPNAAFITFCY